MNPTALMNACMLALSSAGHLVTRVNAGPSIAMNRRDILHGPPAGTADLIVCARGRYFEIECKAGSGRQSPAQRNRERAVLRHEGIYLVAREPGEIVAAVEAALKENR